jgi:hypothetical protein
MKPEPVNEERAVYKRMVQTLESNCAALKNAKANVQIVEMYELLTKYLKGLTYDRFLTLVERQADGSTKQITKSFVSDDMIRQMTTEDIRQLLNDPLSKKKTVERIALLWFGMRISEISSMRDKRSLTEHLLTLMLNKETHESISRMAKSDVTKQ